MIRKLRAFKLFVFGVGASLAFALLVDERELERLQALEEWSEAL